jgi:hypothetical protein
LQDFGDRNQSSQRGPHLVQPFSATPSVARQNITANLRNIKSRAPNSPHHRVRPSLRQARALLAWRIEMRRMTGFSRKAPFVFPEFAQDIRNADLA